MAIATLKNKQRDKKRQKYLKLFKQILPSRLIIDQPTSLRTYESDALSAYKQVPILVLLVENSEQIKACLLVCKEHRIAVISRGAGTGLSGGALPHADGIVLSLAKMNEMLEIDAENRSATVQPGVTNLAISNAVKHLNLYYAPDPSSQIACTIGGNVAENAGGVHCLKYGLTIHNVIGIKIITIDGEMLTLGGPSGDSQGYDLLALLIGSEGMLGIIVEVTVRLLPIPDTKKLIMAAFDDIDNAGDCVSEIIAGGIIPAAIEMMDNLVINATEDFVNAGYPVEASAIILCELDGFSEDVTRQIHRVKQIMQHNHSTLIKQAKDEKERNLLWSGRKSAFPAVGRIAADYYCIDGTIPRSALATVLSEISDLSKKYNLRVANVFHAGDGNLHPLILYDASKQGQFEKTESLGIEILKLCIQHGGTITGEHGVGVEKLGSMCDQFSDQELDQFHRLRTAFDQFGLLNPGKAIPTLARCAEHNAMHVHHGKLAHPHLERF